MGMLREILRLPKYKFVLLTSAAIYWLLYAISSGMLMYYALDLAQLLRTSQVPNPYYFVEWGSFLNLYYSGIVWFPTGHLQLNLLFGPTFFSILLSGLFSLNILLVVNNLRIKRMGMSGLVGMIPALFSGGCCSVPLGISLFGSLLPSAALLSLSYNYVYLTNAPVAALMYISLAYTSKKAVCCNRVLFGRAS